MDMIQTIIWLDDERPVPTALTYTAGNNVVAVKTVAQVICLLETHPHIVLVDLDNDLGENEPEGHTVISWIEERIAADASYIPPEVRFHSANSGRRSGGLEIAIERINATRRDRR